MSPGNFIKRLAEGAFFVRIYHPRYSALSACYFVPLQPELNVYQYGTE